MLFVFFALAVNDASAATLRVGPTGFSSLQDAVDTASNGDTIEVEPGTYDGGIDFQGKDLAIVSTDGASRTTISLSSIGFFWDQGEVGRLEGFEIQANGFRAFQIANSDVEIVDVEVVGAGDGADRGGAVSVTDGGSALFERVSFEDSAGSRGGTLYAVEGAYVQLIDVAIDGSVGDFGGAIYAEDATVDLSGVTIEQVVVDNSGGALYLFGAELFADGLVVRDVVGEGTFGAGIYAGERSEVAVSDSRFEGCQITDLDDDYAGGAIYAEGDTALALSGVIFADNLSTDGGAVALDGATAELIDVTFKDGEATRRGGGIFLTDSAELLCSGCVFEDNIASEGGGAFLGTNVVFEQDAGEWSDNVASGSGGALRADGAFLIALSGSLFESNEARDIGGALYLTDIYRTVDLQSVELTSNRVTNDDGGAVAADGATGLTVSESVFKLNEALSGGGGGIWFAPDSERDLEISDSTFQSNAADREGGGVLMLEGGRLSVLDSQFLRNDAGEVGGAIAVERAESVEVLRVLLHENLAVETGGGYYEREVLSSTFSYNLVVENVADDGGGVAFIDGSMPEIINNTFAGNTANDDGGHVHAAGAPVRLINNIFHQAVDGGAVFADSDAADGTDLFYNDAFENAGGDYTGSLTDPLDESGNLAVDPRLRAYSSDGDETDDDFHLLLDSPCVDAGHPDMEDKDGTRSDMGAYGGIDAAVFDDDGDGFWTNTDCDDDDDTVFPDADEIAYDGLDQDCDGEDLIDVDGDGYTGAEAGGVDCDDADEDVHPDAEEVWYDAVDQDCDGHSDFDQDFDGYDHTSFGGGDCDDLDPAIQPGVAENWYDGVDQDCDGRSDFDADLDGYDSDAYGGSDCNDASALTWPGAPEIAYDGFDQDCDGLDVSDVDGDGHDSILVGGQDCNDQNATIYPGAQDDPYDGLDQDCDGRSEYDQDGDGFDSASFGGTDCDDTDPLIHPLAYETWYDGVDSDCDGWSDFDADRDTYESDQYGGNDCDDTDPITHPDNWEEWYDGVDQDCAGDDDYDADKDGFQGPSGVGEDCDDSRKEANPDAQEIENSLDDDCDGWAEDDDRDGDGLEDWDEWAVGTDHTDPDSDGDGRDDGEEIGLIISPRDSDLDGLIDPWDEDDDGDDILTRSEDLIDVDDDQEADLDVDGDGLPNYLDRDSDGDGYTDLEEGEADRDHDGLEDYVDYTGDYAGGGCAGGPGGQSGAAFLLLLTPVAFRRRELRGLIGPLTAMLIGLVGLAGALLATPEASAEGLSSHGLQVLGTTGDPAGYTRLAYPEGGDFGDLDAGLVVDHAAEPLVEQLPTGNEAVIEQLSTANVVVSGSLGSFTRLEVVMPVHAVGVAANTGLFSAPGDLRVGGVIPAFRPKGLRPGVALAPSVWFPTGSAQDLVGNPGVSGGAVVAVAQEIGSFGWAMNAGARIGSRSPERNVESGAGPLAGLGGHYLATDALAFTAEVAVQGDSGWSSFPLEAGGGARLRLRRGVWTTAGAAVGLNDAVGSARWRAIVGVGWSHRAPEMEVYVLADETIPDGDRDGDGFMDSVDACPDQAETIDGFDDDDGCPELDGDADGVPFARDACPEEPIYPEQDPRYSDGCPKLAELSGDKIIITQSIFFEEGRATILPVSFAVLEAVADIVQEHTELDGILVEGHTNDNGSAELNYRLSEDRARAVVRWLIDAGVDRNRLIDKGYGFDLPLVEHDAADAARINRRVEFTVVTLEDVPDSDRMPSPELLPDR